MTDTAPGKPRYGREPYGYEIARAWAAYNRKFPFVPFYQFAVAFRAGWDATTPYAKP